MRLCVVSHSERALLGLQTGGSERQGVLLAKHMAARGHEVALVVPGYEGPDRWIDGVLLRSGWDPSRGLRFVRALTYRYPTLRRVLADLRADVYYSRGFSHYTPLIISAAHGAGGLALVATTNDDDLLASSGPINFGIGGPRTAQVTGRIGYWWFNRTGLQRSDAVIVQNEAQRQSCQRRSLHCRLLPSIIEGPPSELASLDDSADLIWVGNVCGRRRSKGVDEVVRLAQAVPSCTFVLAGDLSGLQGTETMRRLKQLPNLELTGALVHPDVLRRIAGARVILNTSPSEGFSNVMLEGWSLGKPSLSLSVDPDHLLNEGGLGICADGDERRLAQGLRRLLSDDDDRVARGEAGRDYVCRVHGVDAVCGEFERIIGSLSARAQT
jgi:glycosyltransferase involved in cell wall biosynthesis